jgi:hypothetical protein
VSAGEDSSQPSVAVSRTDGDALKDQLARLGMGDFALVGAEVALGRAKRKDWAVGKGYQGGLIVAVRGRFSAA